MTENDSSTTPSEIQPDTQPNSETANDSENKGRFDLDQDVQPVPGQDEEPAPGQSEQPVPGRDEEPASEQSERLASGQDEQPAPEQDEEPAPASNEQPAAEQGMQRDAETALQPATAPEPKMQHKSIGRTVATLLTAPLVMIVGEVLGALIGDLTPLGVDFGATCGFAVFSMIAVAIMGGWHLFAVSGKAIAEAWKRCWWAIAPTVFICLISILANMIAESPLNPDAAQDILYALVLCVFIGISEEGFFRGYLFNGLLASAGRTVGGMIGAAAVVSLLFGCAHVDWFSANYSNSLVVSQIVLKIIQTSLYSFPLCAVVAKSRNVVGTASLHAMDDFLLYATTLLYTPVDITNISYVDEGDLGGPLIMYYAMFCLAYLPLIPIGVKEFYRIQPPYYGEFVKGDLPQPPIPVSPEAQPREDGSPVPPPTATREMRRFFDSQRKPAPMPQQEPQQTPEQESEQAPQQASEQASEQAPQQASEQAPQQTSDQVPPGQESGQMPGQASGQASGQTPQAPTGSAPGAPYKPKHYADEASDRCDDGLPIRPKGSDGRE